MQGDKVKPIQTPRLQLLPMTEKQLKRCVIPGGPDELARELGVALDGSLFSDVVSRAINIKLEKMSSAPAHEHVWYTFWIIVLDHKTVIGMIGFKGPADTYGQVEIGYGILPAFQGQGYATEAVSGFIDYAFAPRHKGVTAVIAETARDNLASQRVLQKCGLHFQRAVDDFLWWQVAVSDRKLTATS